jgi:hypothetical protein
MELFINDIRVDLDERLPFPLTFNISDVKDLAARKGNNSKTITLPGTKNNTYLMYQVFSVTASEPVDGSSSGFLNFDPSVKATARYYDQGLLQFNGIAQLTECVHKDGAWRFNLIMVSETIDYIGLLSKVRVNELNWSEYSHTLTRANQEDSWSGTIQVNGVPTSNKTGANWDGLGYYYGLIDYGYTRPSVTSFGVEHIPPQVFCYDILKKAFETAGITWTSDFLESQTFKRLLMAFPGGELPRITAADSLQYSAYTTESNNTAGFIIDTLILPDGLPQLLFGGNRLQNLQNTVVDDPYNGTVVTDPSGQIETPGTVLKFLAATEGIMKVNYVGDHDLNIDFTIAGANIVDTWIRFKLRLLIYKNGFIISQDVVYQGLFDNGTGDYAATISFDYVKDIYTNINDELRFVILWNVYDSSVEFDDIPTTFQLRTTLASNTADLNIIKAEQSLEPGGTVFLDAFLPDMDCGTFFKGITTAFNLYVKPSKDNPTVMEIETMDEFYNDSNAALNWTNLVDYSKDYKVTPTVNFASSKYNFLFDADDDYYNAQYQQDVRKQYGSFVVDSQSQFARDKTDFKLPFSQKLLVNIPLDETTYTGLIIPRSFQVKTEQDGTSAIAIKKGKPFLVQLGPMTTANWEYIDEDGISSSEGSYPYVGHLDSLTSPTFDFNFGVPDFVFYQSSAYTTNNLFHYHERYMKEIVSRYGKLLTCYIRIDNNMINLLNFKDLINIDGVVYRLQKVGDYDSGKDQTTLVELIRIIEGENIKTFDLEVPFDPGKGSNWRETEGKFTTGAQTRITEDNIIRITE